jgi:hypothetical protein
MLDQMEDFQFMREAACGHPHTDAGKADDTALLGAGALEGGERSSHVWRTQGV